MRTTVSTDRLKISQPDPNDLFPLARKLLESDELKRKLADAKETPPPRIHPLPLRARITDTSLFGTPAGHSSVSPESNKRKRLVKGDENHICKMICAAILQVTCAGIAKAGRR